MHLKNQALIWATYNAYKAGTIPFCLLEKIQEVVMDYETKNKSDLKKQKEGE